MKKIKIVFFAIILVFISCINENQGEIELHSNNKYFKAKKVYFHKSEKPLGIEELSLLANENKFQTKKEEFLSFGITQDSIYVYFDIIRQDDSDWILELPYPPLTLIHVYQIDEDKNVHSQESGIATPSDKKYSEHPFYQFPIINKVGKIRFFLELKSNDPLTTPVILWNKKTLAQMDGYRHLGFGVFFGILISLSLYNFLLYITIKDRTYLYYVGYILSFGIFFFFVFGYVGYLFRDFIIRFHLQFMPFFATLTSLFAMLFARRFLNIYAFAPNLYQIFQFLIVSGVLLLVSYFFIPVKYSVLFANLHPLIAAALMIIATFVAIRNKYKPAYYFLIAWAWLIFSVVIFIGANLTVFPASFFTHYLQLPGVALEAILLSLALGYRINDLRIREEESKADALRKEIASREQQEKLSLSFKRFVPGEFLKNLNKESILDIRQGDSIACTMSVLFTDIRNFTDLSEKLEPEVLFSFLNNYLEKMEPIIQKYDGFIDKFIGDAIMALFPDETKSLLAAIEMIESSKLINLPENKQLKIGIGIHSGELILGTIGSKSRIDTTVIGDTVNLASRIESLNKQYGTNLLISENILMKLTNSRNPEILIREIDKVRVKGKENPITIYEIIF